MRSTSERPVGTRVPRTGGTTRGKALATAGAESSSATARQPHSAVPRPGLGRNPSDRKQIATGRRPDRGDRSQLHRARPRASRTRHAIALPMSAYAAAMMI